MDELICVIGERIGSKFCEIDLKLRKIHWVICDYGRDLIILNDLCIDSGEEYGMLDNCDLKMK